MRAEIDRMPSIGLYRGVELHDFQPQERIARIVKPAIDAVSAMINADALFAYVTDRMHPPEARLLAAARIAALWELAADNRELRPKVNLVEVRAYTGSLDSLHWANPWHYGSLLEPAPPPGTADRMKRDPTCAADLKAAQSAHEKRAYQRRRLGAALDGTGEDDAIYAG